jgi:endo-1,3(4)-beta-glucanase
LVEHLHRVSFSAPRTPRLDQQTIIRTALDTDIHYELPSNYMRGAGDTYFSGKMLAKLARILMVAEEVGYPNHEYFNEALTRLKQGVEIWLNGSSESPLLYDRSWGGIVSCGCDYDQITESCNNRFPDCPALFDQGQNFGFSFYNDHHFHLGYHIYAAAVISKLDRMWAKQYFENVLLFIRDIANPSPEDPYFPTWRHKDWYLGFSWASGVVTNRGE